MAEAAKAQAAPEGEPSMEEILQSIRRIIAEDDKPAAGAPAAETSPVPDDFGSEVLELTEMVQEDGSVVSLDAAPPAQDVMTNIANAIAPEAPQEEPVVEESPVPEEPVISEEDRLLSEAAAASAAASLKKLAQPKAQPPAPVASPAFRTGNTVEDLTMEALRPMLKAWLDANLPAIVERIVEREVRKLRD